MPAYFVSTEVGYNVYVGSAYIADVSTYAQALEAAKSVSFWNGRIENRVSSYMPCA